MARVPHPALHCSLTLKRFFFHSSFCWRTPGGSCLCWASRSGPFPWTPPLCSPFLVSTVRGTRESYLSTGHSRPRELFMRKHAQDSQSRMAFSSHGFSGMNTENTESQRMNKIISEIQALQEVVTRFRQMRLDATEFACLKCIVTFKAGEWHRFGLDKKKAAGREGD